MRLWCVISGHGFGHFFQVAPLLNALHRRTPLLVHVVARLPATLLARYLEMPFTHDARACDVGLVQDRPLVVDEGRTLEALGRLHGEAGVVEREMAAMAAWRPDLVVSNIAYFPLKAAHRLGIPSVAVAGITWQGVMAAYFDVDREPLRGWWEEMQDCYRCTTLALLPTPTVATEVFARQRVIAPITLAGRRRSRELRERLEVGSSSLLGLVSLGGIPHDHLPVAALTEDPGVVWLTDIPLPVAHPRVRSVAELTEWNFVDIAASVDGVVSKPGYNMAVAAAVHGVPFLYVRRGVFPDEAPICEWVHRHNRARELGGVAFREGRFAPVLRALMGQPAPVAPVADGGEEGAEEVMAVMGGRAIIVRDEV